MLFSIFYKPTPTKAVWSILHPSQTSALSLPPGFAFAHMLHCASASSCRSWGGLQACRTENSCLLPLQSSWGLRRQTQCFYLKSHESLKSQASWGFWSVSALHWNGSPKATADKIFLISPQITEEYKWIVAQRWCCFPLIDEWQQLSTDTDGSSFKARQCCVINDTLLSFSVCKYVIWIMLTKL